MKIHKWWWSKMFYIFPLVAFWHTFGVKELYIGWLCFGISFYWNKIDDKKTL
jgi:hypothetical protein